VEYARLETAELRDVDETYYYGASCSSCLHASRLDLVALRRHLGDNFPLVKIRERLRCEICGSRQVVVAFLGPHQRTGSVAHLFDKPLRR